MAEAVGQMVSGWWPLDAPREQESRHHQVEEWHGAGDDGQERAWQGQEEMERIPDASAIPGVCAYFVRPQALPRAQPHGQPAREGLLLVVGLLASRPAQLGAWLDVTSRLSRC